MALIQGAYMRVGVNSPEAMDVAETEIIENLHPNNYMLHVEECTPGSTYKFSTFDQDNNSPHSTVFTIGEDFSEIFRNGKSAITTSIKEDDKIIFVTYFGTKKCQRTYDFADYGVTMVLEIGSGVKRTYEYKRGPYFNLENPVFDYC